MLSINEEGIKIPTHLPLYESVLMGPPPLRITSRSRSRSIVFLRFLPASPTSLLLHPPQLRFSNKLCSLQLVVLPHLSSIYHPLYLLSTPVASAIHSCSDHLIRLTKPIQQPPKASRDLHPKWASSVKPLISKTTRSLSTLINPPHHPVSRPTLLHPSAAITTSTWTNTTTL